MTTRDDLILAALDEIRADIREVKAEVKRTNGRVGKLELWRAGLEAIANTRGWRFPALVSVAGALTSGTVVAVIAALLSS
ncbi:MAG: hypothetical protein AB1416_11285 [Actinomycetota bacterium]